MAIDELTIQLGVGAVKWRLPSLVHRLEAMQRNRTHGFVHAKLYALLAGLPDSVLSAGDFTGRPAIDLDRVENLLQRQGCTIRHLDAAGDAAFTAVFGWWQEAMPKEDASEQGNEELPAEMDPPALTD